MKVKNGRYSLDVSKSNIVNFFYNPLFKVEGPWDWRDTLRFDGREDEGKLEAVTQFCRKKYGPKKELLLDENEFPALYKATSYVEYGNDRGSATQLKDVSDAIQAKNLARPKFDVGVLVNNVGIAYPYVLPRSGQGVAKEHQEHQHYKGYSRMFFPECHRRSKFKQKLCRFNTMDPNRN
ncbi:hypothetical protein FEM48_Zijuj03G0183000 [Ziziphus jujuba var. spinosa]|uniref:Uncharacterized protein n=1 Tax=Ziziphus jujuba var. spinosa TaxID=714518 RepID=A0A978VRV7_ZIZJJ|nr:hypothetical protein FEM48_Zijuj03G0183000 [Ziziphus jujuba var. spinosa]